MLFVCFVCKVITTIIMDTKGNNMPLVRFVCKVITIVNIDTKGNNHKEKNVMIIIPLKYPLPYHSN